MGAESGAKSSGSSSNGKADKKVEDADYEVVDDEMKN